MVFDCEDKLISCLAVDLILPALLLKEQAVGAGNVVIGVDVDEIPVGLFSEAFVGNENQFALTVLTLAEIGFAALAFKTPVKFWVIGWHQRYVWSVIQSCRCR